MGNIRWVHTRILQKDAGSYKGARPLYLPAVEGKQPLQHSAPGSPPWLLEAGLG